MDRTGMLFLLLAKVIIKTPYEVSLGKWNITRVQTNKGGLAYPDPMNWVLELKPSGESRVEGLLNSTRSDTKRSVQLDFHSGLSISVEGEEFLSGAIGQDYRTSVGTVRGLDYSLTLLSNYRVELTLFDPLTGEMTLYRMLKAYPRNSSQRIMQYVLSGIIVFILKRMH